MSEIDDLAKRVHDLEAENLRLKAENRTYETKLESLVKAGTDQSQETMRGLQRSFDIVVEVLGEALDYGQRETGGHSKRVTAFTIAIARRLDIPKEQIEMIARGALLHDIGKMAIPDRILSKPAKLVAAEAAIMRQHCYLGYKLVQKIPVLREAAEIVYTHHEYFDGTGYPRGLKGEEIPVGARIVAVANTLDSITSDLPYRPARSLSVAREEIQRCAGGQFDPRIVTAFMEMRDDMWSKLAQDIRSSVQTIKPSITDSKLE